MTYRPCFSQEEYIQVFDKASNCADYDFVEGIVYSKEKAVIMTGKMVSLKVLKNNILALNPIGLWWKTWFYKHVETYLEKGSLTGIRDEDVPSEYVELIPLRDYFHRHTRSIFWVIFNLE